MAADRTSKAAWLTPAKLNGPGADGVMLREAVFTVSQEASVQY